MDKVKINFLKIPLFLGMESVFMTPFQKKVLKPWGEEIIYTPENLERTGKILHIKKKHKLSLQYHDQKEETLCLFSGNAIIWLENDQGEVEKKVMEPMKGYTVLQGRKHRIETIEDCFVLEVSSPEKGNTFRIEDDFARPHETEEMRQEENRGWKAE